ncbi:hypothetical protein KBD45_03540 [Candidatus Dojkabacteria bacterium]|nr:hypothetical protein [Candidatus Dojkabacteria bacterium]
MSLDLEFNKSLSAKEIEEKTSLKVEVHNGSEFLKDQYGNIVFFKSYGITLYGGPRNPQKILDELIRAFDIMFIDDEAIDKLDYESEKYKAEDLFLETMDKYGYVTDGKIIVPERDESEYLPYKINWEAPGDDSELPF